MRKNTKRMTALLLVLVMAVTMSTGTALADEPTPLDVDAMEEVMQEEDPLEEINLQDEAEQEGVHEEPTDEVDQIQATSLSLRGSGTAADPYQIYTEAELRLLNSTDKDVLGSHYILMNDIRLSGTENNWEPIGKYSSDPDSRQSFKGVFDGNGYTISNIQINKSETYQGLFGSVKDAEIRNLTISDSSILSGGTSGSICGSTNDTVIVNCHSNAEIRSEKSGAIGGLIGYAGTRSYISGCTFSGIVEAATGYSTLKMLGGIAGKAQSVDILHCINYGLVNNPSSASAYIGGITGELKVSGNIENCYNYGEISSDRKGAAGGFVGEASSWSDYNVTIKNCINEGDVWGNGNTGGILGKANGGNLFLHQNTNTASVTGPSETGGILGYVYSNVDVADCINSGDIIGSGGIVGYTHTTKARKNISNCLNIGTVDGSGYIGGITGRPATADATYIENCVVASEWITSSAFAEGHRIAPSIKAVMSNNYAYEGTLIRSQTVTGEHDNMDGADATMAQLTSQSFYEGLGWDFTDVWAMSGTSPYPILQNAARSDQDLIALMDYGLTFRQALALNTPKRKLILNEIRANDLSREQIVNLAEGLLEIIDRDNIENMYKKLGETSVQTAQSIESALPFRYEGLTPEEVRQAETGADSIQPYIFPFEPQNLVNENDKTGTYFKVVGNTMHIAAAAHAVLPQLENYQLNDRPYMMMTINNEKSYGNSVLGDYCIVYRDDGWYPHYTLGLWDDDIGSYRNANIRAYEPLITSDEVFFYVEIYRDAETDDDGINLTAVEYRLFDDEYGLLYSMKALFPASELASNGSDAKIERIISMSQYREDGADVDTNTGTIMHNAQFNRSVIFTAGDFWTWSVMLTDWAGRAAQTNEQLQTVTVNNYMQWYEEDITIEFNVPNPPPKPIE